MNLVLKTKQAVVASLMMLASSSALAGSIDSNDAFYMFYDTVDKWAAGALGTGLAITMLLMGGAIGVARNSPMPALTGIAGAAFLHWGPEVIKQLMTNGAVF